MIKAKLTDLSKKEKADYSRFCYLCSNSGMVPRGYASQALDYTLGTPSCWQKVPCPKCMEKSKESEGACSQAG